VLNSPNPKRSSPREAILSVQAHDLGTKAGGLLGVFVPASSARDPSELVEDPHAHQHSIPGIANPGSPPELGPDQAEGTPREEIAERGRTSRMRA